MAGAGDFQFSMDKWARNWRTSHSQFLGGRAPSRYHLGGAAGTYRVDHRQLDAGIFPRQICPAGTVSPSISVAMVRTPPLILSVIAAFAAMFGVTILIWFRVQDVHVLSGYLTDGKSEWYFRRPLRFPACGKCQQRTSQYGLRITAEVIRPNQGWFRQRLIAYCAIFVRKIESLRRGNASHCAGNRDGISILNSEPCDHKGRIHCITAKGEASYQSGKAAGTVNGLFIDVTSLKEMEHDADLQRREVARLSAAIGSETNYLDRSP